MIKTGQFRMVLLPGADTEAFVAHMKESVFTHANALQLTRITRSFSHQLLDAGNGQYVWQSVVDLQTDAGYDFVGQADGVQAAVADFAILIGADELVHVG